MVGDEDGGDGPAQAPSRTLPSVVLDLPPDLAATVGLVLLTDIVILVPGISDTPLRVLLGLPFLLVLPGYALVSALFPEAGPSDADADDDLDKPWIGRIDGLERAALSFGLSIAIVPVVGLGLHFTPWGIQLVPILVTLSLVTLALVAVAVRRRRRVPASERFTVPYRDWLAAARTDLFAPETRTDATLNVVLAVSLIVAAAFTGYAVAVPKETEKFTEFYVLSETEEGGLVAADYPTEFDVGESRPVVLGVENHEHREMRYSVVVLLQEVTFAENESIVGREAELTRWKLNLPHDGTWREEYAITPPFAGDELRVAFLLYRGDVPSDPSVDNAYHELHLWVTVNGSS